MTFVKLNPIRGFENMSRRFGEFWDDLEQGISFEMGGFSPRVDLTEDDKYLFLHAEIPGMTKEEVKISVNEERMLTIKGEKKKEQKAEGKNFVRTERVYGEFSRSFMLPDNLDFEKIGAKIENGVLELSIPKVEPPKPKDIEINIA